jgi:uncharacterized protein YhdP
VRHASKIGPEQIAGRLGASPETPVRGAVAGAGRLGLIALAGVLALSLLIVLAYQVALSRVPQQRAVLERLVRSHAGLEVRFGELGLRWGWYGPEAIFRRVELGEPGSSRVLLRAPELTVGFDAWRTMRSGQLEAGRVVLVAPDIDLQQPPAPPRLTGAAPVRVSPPDRLQILEHWRGGRIDIEGGSVRLADPAGGPDPLAVQIRRAVLRRTGDEWSVFALVFLPERLGRTARIALRVEGALDRPDTLSGALRLEARRLSFAGWRDLRTFSPPVLSYVPIGGSGDLTVNVDFERGRIIKSDGSIRAGGIVLASRPAGDRRLDLDRVRAEWRLARHNEDWRLRVESLELGAPSGEMQSEFPPRAASGALTVDAGADGQWVRGKLEHAPLRSVASVARWLAPHLDLADVELEGIAQNVTFDWDARREQGQRLEASARLEDVSLTPPSHSFALSGLTAHISGNDVALDAAVQSRAARLELLNSTQYPIDDIRVVSQLRVSRTDGGWEVAADRLELRHADARLALTGTLAGGGQRLQPDITLHGVVSDADVPFVTRLLGDAASTTFGPAASSLTSGRIERAEFDLRSPVDELPFGTERGAFAGSLQLRDAVLAAGDPWPEVGGVDAQVEWHGAQVTTTLESGHAGPFRLNGATAEWDATGKHAARISGNIAGDVQDALAWLREHPQLAAYARHVDNLDLQGEAQVAFDVEAPSGPHIVVSLSNARLTPVPGVLPLEALTGSLTFDAGRLQRSTLSGRWLGGAVSFHVAERRDHGRAVIGMQAHGVLDARQLATVASLDPGSGLDGDSEWTADLAYLPPSGTLPSQWHLRADSNLLGVASSLPEPLAKSAGAAVPLHLELSGTDETAALRVALGDRLRSQLALHRQAGTDWSLERGAVNFGAGTASLPVEPVLVIEGRVAHLDLPAYLSAWQQMRDSAEAPPLRAQLSAGEMAVAGRTYSEVTLSGQRSDDGAELQLESAALAGMIHWPRAGGPVAVHLTRMAVAEPLAGEPLLAIAALGPRTQLSIDELRWQGRPVGRVDAMLAAGSDGVAVSELRLAGAAHEGHGSVHCQPQLTSCRMSFTLESRDVAATLEDFGFRPDVSATQAELSGELEWQPGTDKPWLASASGRLAMQLSDGTTQVAQAAQAASSSGSTPFALLSVPALVSGMGAPDAEDAAAAPRELRFARLQAQYELHDGQAATSDLHFDGDAEILMRGRTGLVARDYDQQVWILKGEERLPAAVRRFGPTPRIAAAWLTLRGVFSGADEDRARGALRLQGSWDAPAVVAAN